MSPTATLSIPLSKKKIIKMIVISLVFTCIGCWMLIAQPQSSNVILNSPFIKYPSAVLSVLMGILGGYFFFQKLQDNRPALILAPDGITDNSSAISAGFIPWSDITEVTSIKVSGQKMVVIQVHNPEDYIQRQASTFKQRIMRTNYTRFGTCIAFSPSTIDIKFEDLLTELQQRFSNSQHA
jgi:uncharacterized protein YneF (UPF0154 family)